MKETGMVRQVDYQGRIVLPTELRESMDIYTGTSLGVYTDEGVIILKKYEPGCILCGEIRDVYDFKGKSICRQCKEEMKSSE